MGRKSGLLAASDKSEQQDRSGGRENNVPQDAKLIVRTPRSASGI